MSQYKAVQGSLTPLTTPFAGFARLLLLLSNLWTSLIHLILDSVPSIMNTSSLTMNDSFSSANGNSRPPSNIPRASNLTRTNSIASSSSVSSQSRPSTASTRPESSIPSLIRTDSIRRTSAPSFGTRTASKDRSGSTKSECIKNDTKYKPGDVIVDSFSDRVRFVSRAEILEL